MKSLIINREKYIKTHSTSHEVLPITAIFVFSLICVISILGSSLYAVNRGIEEASDEYGEEEQIVISSLGDGEDKEEQLPIENNEDDESSERNAFSAPEIIRSSVPENYFVTKIVDGDTIYVSGIETRIRLIGINTPEIHNGPVQCYGPEATDYLAGLILGKYVGLEYDAASGDIDRYGRPLRFVYYNGENVNQKILLEGYGKETSYGSEYKYRDIFVESEKSAIAGNKGLWSPVTCNGLE